MMPGKKVLYLLLTTATIHFLLMIPDRATTTYQVAEAKPFVWNMDDRWAELEHEFNRLRLLPAVVLDSLETVKREAFSSHVEALRQHDFIEHSDPRLAQLLTLFFEWSPVVAASNQTSEYLLHYSEIRNFIKQQSTKWGNIEPYQRTVLYPLLYGMRAAVEEILLQTDSASFDPILWVTNEIAKTPSTRIEGIEVHSGDLFVSRGGAEVSAFISRGNDYPGNFSHVALLYVSETGEPAFIEAHIERGVAIATAGEYLKDKKLRFMVLRPRADLPALKNDPLLPHQAALFAKQEAEKRHIPYDFKMNFYDSSAMFCSEVGSYAYKKHGIQLWQAESTISSIGTAQWLNTFGVENFLTQMPSDLEYDPQLSIVVEWCDPETLFKDHLDNAVMDALLEKANEGMEISYNPWLLPIARVVKGFSMVQNVLGKPGIIPEGMTATQALKNNSFVDRYQNLKEKTEIKIQQFISVNNYRPPYWQMVKMATESLEE
ncbi:MAG: hypothetical protein KF687_07705 [Cyclobacteriaceae bacterium]|nr:hypothetical protein [Cyclobacteriaceae bacterium]